VSWDDWASGVLASIGAPIDEVNVDTLWAWSNAESGPDVMRWNNPLNTTEPWLSPPSHPMNSVGVQAYMDVASGVAATVVTLENGYYPVILDHLRRSVPRQQWGDACANLDTWGTHCAWINSVFGTYTGSLGGSDLTPDQDARLTRIEQALLGEPPAAGVDYHGWSTQVSQALSDLKAAIAALPTGGTVDLAPINTKLDRLLAELHTP